MASKVFTRVGQTERRTTRKHGYCRTEAWKVNLQMTMRIMQKSWIPEPNRELRIMGYCGGLKTSPWTFFHPDSSIVSSWLGSRKCQEYIDLLFIILVTLKSVSSKQKPFWSIQFLITHIFFLNLMKTSKLTKSCQVCIFLLCHPLCCS